VRSRITLIVGALLLAAVAGGAWWFESVEPAPNAPSGAAGSAATTATSTASTSAYRVKVTRGGRVLATFGLAQLEGIGMKQVTVQGGTETGPALLDVLGAAGVESCSTVTILGSGARDSGRLEIAFADIGPDTVLDVAKRGTVKVAGPNIPRESRVRDITEIQVR